MANPQSIADGSVASHSAAAIVTRSRKVAQPGKRGNVNPAGAKPHATKTPTTRKSIPAEEPEDDASLDALVTATADDASPQQCSRRDRKATDFFGFGDQGSVASATKAPTKKKTKVDGSQSPSKGSAAKKKKDSATAQKEEDSVGFVSNKPIHKGLGRPTQTAPEFVMHFFKCKSLLTPGPYQQGRAKTSHQISSFVDQG
jgi:hypothetical protein